jgi:hypothetical protein
VKAIAKMKDDVVKMESTEVARLANVWGKTEKEVTAFVSDCVSVVRPWFTKAKEVDEVSHAVMFFSLQYSSAPITLTLPFPLSPLPYLPLTET